MVKSDFDHFITQMKILSDKGIATIAKNNLCLKFYTQVKLSLKKIELIPEMAQLQNA